MNILHYTPWKIEQTAFAPEAETQIEEQLAFSNGYLSEYAFFEEHYSGEQLKGTFIDGLLRQDGSEPLAIPNPAAISLRLNDERLDLHEWQVEKFYRSLNKGASQLTRTFCATSPKGYTVEVEAVRSLNAQHPNLLEETYTVHFVNYAGVASFMTLLGDQHTAEDWYPLQMIIEDNMAYIWMQAAKENVQICAAQRHVFYKNGVLQDERPIKIDKKRVLGFAYMHDVFPGDTYSIHKQVAVVDSREDVRTDLPSKALEILYNAPFNHSAKA